MKIKEIKCAGLRGATPEGGWSQRAQARRLRPHADRRSHRSGLTGLGSVFTSDALVRAALQVLEPLYRGENALEPERVSEKLHQNTFWLGRGGAVTHAISGIDIALWDILGQGDRAAGRPVARRPLSRSRAALRLAAHGGARRRSPNICSPSSAQGFRAFKIGWGPFGRREQRRSTKRSSKRRARRSAPMRS